MLLHTFLRLFFKLLYHQFAWSYDLVAAFVSLGQWKSWVRSVLPFLSGPTVLEIGHGPGHLQVAMQALPLQVFGLDESRQMSRQAYKRLVKSKLTPCLVNGYAQNLPFPDNYFQQVVATFPSEFITQPHTLAEIFRVLHPGGELLLLPIAWITSQKFPYRQAAWLFRVTHQVPASQSVLKPETLNLEPFGKPFRQAGFEIRTQWLHLPASTLLLIHALRPRSPEPLNRQDSL